jgi:hypothetical protein
MTEGLKIIEIICYHCLEQKPKQCFEKNEIICRSCVIGKKYNKKQIPKWCDLCFTIHEPIWIRKSGSNLLLFRRLKCKLES